MSLIQSSGAMFGGFTPTPTAWNINAGNASAQIVSFPNAPTSPLWTITPGNGTATINAYPGQP